MTMYRKKPVVIEAREFTWDVVNELIDWMGIRGTRAHLAQAMLDDDLKVVDAYLIIPTMEGDMRASLGDYIIKGVHGEFYPCKPDIFEETYEKVAM